MATAALPEEVSNDFLECTICCDTYKNPKILIPCLHTFCEHCLREWVQKNDGDTFPCPICRQPVPLPQDGVDGLKNNSHLASLVKAVTEHHKIRQGKDVLVCTSCDEGKPATSRCSECAEFLCANCESVHRRVRATKAHTLFTFEELKTGKYDKVFRARTAPPCSKHSGEILKLYCRTCEAPICSECALFEHRDSQHDLKRIEEVAAEKKETILALTPQCQARMQLFRQTEEVQKRLKEQLQLNAEGARQNVHKTVQTLTALVKEEGERLLTCIDTEEKTRKKQIDAEIEAAQISLASAKSTCEFAETLAREGGDYEVVSFSQDMTTRLNDLTKPPADAVDFELANITVDYSVMRQKVATSCHQTSEYFLSKSTAKELTSMLRDVSQSQPTEDVPLNLEAPCILRSLKGIVEDWEDWSEHMKGISCEEPPEVTVQKSTISADMEKELRKGDTWFLVAAKWWKQWTKYVGYDSQDMYGIGDPANHPGTIDNSALLKDPKNPDAVFLKDNLIDELDYRLVPVEAFCILVSWYGIKDRHVIPRKVVEHGLFVKHLKVEVFLVELNLYRHPNMDHCVTQLYSKGDTIGQMEEDMRTLFNIPKNRSVRLWNKYMSNTYEHLNKPENTVGDFGLYGGQIIVIEEQNADGSWPRGPMKTRPKKIP
ncbi:PREDICTED: protein PML-like [Branchiostoma belcheri]|uniref:ubiquitinyl hydrolase 1 n=1 Tax=Branchiostoma belcheri TaxID=7741 RepID=A0A6P5AZG9_BRABE|nr:PREDICTED: protein PML-like [Branchiostoma belcheri]